MGSEQSSSRRSTFEYVPQDTDTNFERLQREQRLIYENIMSQQRAQTRPTVSTRENVRIERNTSERPIGLQNNPSMRVQPVPATRTMQFQPNTSIHSSTSVERQRTPYSYTSAQLTNTTVPQPSIYPNLRNEVHSPRSSSVLGTRAEERQADSEFVFIKRINKNIRINPSAPPLSRSHSSDNRNRATNNNQKNDANNCQTCNNKFTLKIFQCPNGHSSCSDCRSKNALCGVCPLQITDMRNITLEDYVSQQKVQCPNADDGCCLLVKMIEINNHVKECPFKEITCPVNLTERNCSWRGKSRQIADHFNDVHPENVQGKVDMELLLTNICFSNRTLFFVPMGSFYFLVHVKVCETERKIFMAVQLLGTAISAAKWNYEFHVFNKREPKRKFQFNSICTSANLPAEDLFREANCVALPQAYAMTFINQGTLSYKFYIKQNQENKDFKENQRGRFENRRRKFN